MVERTLPLVSSLEGRRIPLDRSVNSPAEVLRRQLLRAQAHTFIAADFQDWKKLKMVIVLGATVNDQGKLGGLMENDVSSPLVGGGARAIAAA
jgi:hypothetical protein